ncbi:aminopeptidase N [Ferrimonas gelatinilytica]|uniref:Aminopeptidase N n=1 Tax=Ferrimonas gelatinilytica TaxID=1255257 RepID=A0ABP9RV88_9GAMM
MQQIQAKRRMDYQAPDFTVEQIDLTFELDDHATRVTAVSQLRRCREGATELRLDGEQLTLVSVSVDGESWPHTLEEGQLVLALDQAECELTVVTELDPANNTSLEGLYQSGGAFCTQCEAEGFRRITYFLDRPDVLARYRTRIEADRTRFPFLLSNGNKVASGHLPDGRHFCEWEDPFPKPSYLFALVAGDFDRLTDTFTTASGRDVALELYVDRGNLSRAEHAMVSLKRAMAWDEARFGLEYDLDIYMIVAVDFFNMGAMENKGLNIFNSKAVLADPQTATDDEYHRIESIIGHEYFHNWTGNRVTCRDWFQLSLKEGLTVFRDQEFSSDVGSPVVNRILAVKTIRNHQFAEDAGPMAHPIRPEQVIEMNNFYTVTVYDKGAEVIRMMHTLLGEAAFQAGMRCYFERHDGQAVTCDDFVAAMEDASGVDLSQFRLWYSQSGTPVVTAQEHYDAEQGRLRLVLNQHTRPTADQGEKHPLHIPVRIQLIDREGRDVPLICDGQVTDPVLNFTEASQEWCFEQLPGPVVLSLFDNFSAPVKLEQALERDALALLLAHAGNDFARWDAGQRLLSDEVFALAEQAQEAVSDITLDALRAVLLNDQLDPALSAQLLTLPAEATLAQAKGGLDPETLHLARRQAMEQIGWHLEDELNARYRQCVDPAYRSDAEAVGRRALKNACLFLLAQSGKVQAQQLCEHQFKTADNMTDRLAALNALNQAQLPAAASAMAEFEQQWRNDPLVMDKWFSQIGTLPGGDVVAKIRGAMDHPAFDLANPNRVRALISAFAAGNRQAFHAEDGSGYTLLTDILIKLNGINPQNAARMMTPLLEWRDQDAERQALMKAQLQRLAELPDLSRDLYEKVSKALG